MELTTLCPGGKKRGETELHPADADQMSPKGQYTVDTQNGCGCYYVTARLECEIMSLENVNMRTS
jgi:hypothetical protein